MKKESLREKIQQLKEESEGILQRDETPEDLKLFIKSLFLILEVVLETLLKKKVRKNSSNSGTPPSRNNGSNGNRNSSDGDRNPKLGTKIENTREVKTQQTVSPFLCNGCDYDLSAVKVTEIDEREKIDIVYEVVSHSVKSEVKICPSCKTKNKGKFPVGMSGKVQYGIGVKASIINFLCVQMMSLERVQEHFRGLIGRSISQAVMLKYTAQFSQSLESWELKMKEQLLKKPAIHVDETSMRVSKLNHWIHSYSYGDIVLQFIDKKRGTDAINKIGIIPNYEGTIIHDCYSSYFTYKNVTHALCGPHLLRELKYIEDLNKHKWATQMKEILQKAAKTIAKRKKIKVLYKSEQEHLVKNYKDCLQSALKELPDFPKARGKKGRPKHTEAQNLYLRLKSHQESILRFTSDKHIDFSNNRAERDLRMSKVKQKVSGCFRTLKYAEHYCRATSYIKTMRYRGYSSLQAIMLALQGQIPD